MSVSMFPPSPKKNRRMTSKEFEEELNDAKCWHRVPRTFIFDHPTYPWVKPDYTKCVNFDLNPPL